MKTKFVTLLKYLQPMEAHILKGRLEAEGVPCFLADENITTLNPFYAQAIGGVKLKVNAADAQKATEILAIDKLLNHHDYFPETEEPELIKMSSICPNCGAPAGRKKKLPFGSKFISVLKAAFTGNATVLGPQLKCTVCGHKWNA